MTITHRTILLNSASERGGMGATRRPWTTRTKSLISGAAMACLALLPLEVHAAAKSDVDHNKWWAWAEVGGFYQSENQSEAEVEVFFPIAQSAYSLLFLDVEGELFEHDMQDGSVALGYRQMFSNGWNFGVWAGPEVRRTDEGNRFWRFSAGVELLHADYDARLNAYAPFTGPQASPSTSQLALQGIQIFMTGGAEVPLWGFDGEVGVRAPLETAGFKPNNVELRLYGGGFYFDASEALEEIAGPKARAELRVYDVIPNLVGSRLTAEYEYSYDDVRGDRHKAGARFRIPFDTTPTSVASLPSSGHPLTRQERRMLDGLERADIFVTRSGREQVGDALTGVIFDRVAYVDPADDLSDVSDTEGPNTLIIVDGTISTSETEDIQGDQTIQGGGSTIPVFGVRSSAVTNFTAPGAAALIDSTVAGDVLALQGDHTHIAGLDINGNGTAGHGINVGDNKSAAPIAPGTWNIAIDQTDIHDVGGDGIYVGDDNAHVLIFNGTIADVNGSGIDLNDSNDDIRILDIDFTNVGIGNRLPAVFSHNANTSVTISNVNIDTTTGAGVRVGLGDGNEVHVTDAQMTNIQGNFDGGVSVEGNNNTVTVADTSVTNSDGRGIYVSGDANNATITNTTITNTDAEGVFLTGPNQTVLTNVTVTNAGLVGIRVQRGGDVAISNSTVSGAVVDGLQVRFDTNTVAMDTTTFAGAIGDDVVSIDTAGNILSGAGNVSNATFGDSFCEVTGAQSGSFGFSAPVTTCP